MLAIVCVGVSASGKSYWAERQRGYSVSCRDNIRRLMMLKENPHLDMNEFWDGWGRFTRKNKNAENEVTKIQREEITDLAKRGQNVIIADTNLNTGRRNDLVKFLTDLGYKVDVRFFDISFEEACRRDSARKNGVGVGVIWNQYKRYYEISGGRKRSSPSGKPKAVIFDIDGTLAVATNRGFYEWDKVKDDAVIADVADMFRAYRNMGYIIIALSGRKDVCREDTLNWLIKNDLDPNFLFMRDSNDSRKDSEVKSDIYFDKIDPYCNVTMVVDDRPQVTREWELIGLTVARVANQYEEF